MITNKKRLAFKNVSSEIKRINRRIVTCVFLIFALLLLLCIRLLTLSSFEHRYYAAQLEHNQYKKIPIAPARGLIYDRDGTLLAKNIPVFSLDIIPAKTKNLTKTLTDISRIIQITPTEKKEFYKQLKFHYKTDEIPLKMALTANERSKFSVQEYRFPATVIKARLLREYPLKNVFESVVGYVGRINQSDLQSINQKNYVATNYIGKTGIEKIYEKILHGKIGYKIVKTNALGKIIKTIKIIKPTPGKNLYLTLDGKLQETAYHAFSHNTGSAVALDPNNGQVLALVSHPGFNPNLFVNGISEKHYYLLTKNPDKPLFNRALHGLYPMASTVKPFLALAALNDKLITKNLTIFDPGYFKFKNSHHYFHDWLRGGHGYLNVSRAIWVSCDTFFYRLANLMGIARIDRTLHAFGFGKKPKIDLPNTLAGNVPSPAWKEKVFGKPWYPGDTVITGIGQGSMQVTPLQLADAVSIFALRGKRFQPNLLLKTESPNNHNMQFNTKKLAETVPFNNADDWKTIISAMQNVIINPEGTGFRFGRHPAYTVAAKTGTAQVISRKHTSVFTVIPKKLRDHSLFMGFAPIQQPKIALSVIAENTRQAPAIARKIMDKYLLKEK